MKLLRAHPGLCLVFALCMCVGVGLSVWLLGEDWSLVRRVSGGLLGGAGVALVITAPRIIG